MMYFQVEALRRTDHPSKESYRLSLIKKLKKLSPMLQKREQAPKCGSNEEEEEKKDVLQMLVLRHLAICDAGESLKIQTDRK
jgi:3-polyprenyl-4-hydroxybenzoate decarboxylase